MTRASSIFRQEAIEHRERPGAQGRPVQIDDLWSRVLFPLLLAVAAATVAFAFSFRVHEYASGPALTRFSDARSVTVARGGVVESVFIEPGQSIVRGAALFRLHDVDEQAEVLRLSAEIESRLIHLLREPGNALVKSDLASLAARRNAATAVLDDRTARAPIDGFVSDVRVRPQQHVEPGDVAVAITQPDSDITLIAFLPGQYQPVLHAGQTARFSLEGAPFEYTDVVIQSVSNEVVAAEEARRFLALSDAVTLDGPVTIVHGTLPRSFSSRGEVLRYTQGLTGRVEVRVREESIALTMFPVLRSVVGAP